MIVLGVETSCDETSVALINENDILANQISSQIIHQRFGGVVPELASRNHLRLIEIMVQEALKQAGISLNEVDGFGVTYGPGLVGALLVGLNFVKGLSLAMNKPFVGVNHIEGHIFANFIDHPELKPPFLSLVVSGGHTHLIIVKDFFEYSIIGKTRDDAVGEAFDKVAKMLNLGYPGGPVIDNLAKEGDENAITFPIPVFKNTEGFEFSYSGLKTAVLNYIRKNQDRSEEELKNIAAGFQKAAVTALVKNSIDAARKYSLRNIVIAGGVAANSRLRSLMKEEAEKYHLNVYYPSHILCMDNAAMIAKVAQLKLKRGLTSPLSLAAYPFLPIDKDYSVS
ncbi:MAG: tRNA (adenosine(37)-N6)-threonylcarbamoyltransferase complex transferase subunit TsaD [Calditrichia bacterium]